MLYKNGEPYKLAPNDIKAINEIVHSKWPVTIVYPPERIVKSRSKENLQPDKPNSISFPLTSTVKNKNGAEQWKYAENVIIKEHGVKKYTPKNLRYTGRRAFEETDIELVWFLFMKSEYCKGGQNQGKTLKFMFEDKISEAEVRAEKESVKSQVNALIWGKDFGLSETRMRALAKAYFIKNVDDLTFAQVKIAVEHAIMRDKDKGFSKFIKMTKMDDLIQSRGMIQDVIDKGFLKYDPTKREWLWIEKDKRPEKVCKVPPSTDANDVMYDYYMGNKDFQENVDLIGKIKSGSSE